jgi:hypothetical protein
LSLSLAFRNNDDELSASGLPLPPDFQEEEEKEEAEAFVSKSRYFVANKIGGLKMSRQTGGFRGGLLPVGNEQTCSQN